MFRLFLPATMKMRSAINLRAVDLRPRELQVSGGRASKREGGTRARPPPRAAPRRHAQRTLFREGAAPILGPNPPAILDYQQFVLRCNFIILWTGRDAVRRRQNLLGETRANCFRSSIPHKNAHSKRENLSQLINKAAENEILINIHF